MGGAESVVSIWVERGAEDQRSGKNLKSRSKKMYI